MVACTHTIRTVTLMRRSIAAVPAAVIGMLAAHSLAYRLVAPDGMHRHDLLELTGHGWTSLTPLLLGAGLIAVVAGAWRRAARAGRPVRLAEIVLAQATVYSVVETVERVAAGVSPWPGAALVLAGMFVQLPVALLVWAVLRYVVDPVVTALRARLNPIGTGAFPSLGFHVVPVAFVSVPARNTAGRSPPLHS